MQAYRRPSTASGRLSSQAATTYHRPAPPKLAANRSEYWGAGSNNSNKGDSNSVSRGGYQRQQRFARQPPGSHGFLVRERPLSAGCHPSTSSSSRAPANIAAGGTTTAVETCTRNRAGIVRSGGRDGRAAPPPTPPPPRSPSSPHVAANSPAWQKQQGQRPGAPQDNMRRRRPSTAGPQRSPAAAASAAAAAAVAAAENISYYRRFDHEPARVSSTENVSMPAGDAVAVSPGFSGVGCSSGGTRGGEHMRSPRDGAELGGCAPRPRAGDPLACQGCSFPSRVGHDGDGGQAACQQSEMAGTAHLSTHAQSPSLNRSIVYRRSSGGDERGRSAHVTGCRRRPASAAPPRSRVTNVCDRFRDRAEGRGSSRDGTESGFDRVSAVEPTRGRPNARDGGRGVMQRPRSASATTGRRASLSDVGAFATFAAGGGVRTPPSAARARAQSASTTPAAVVPSFVVSEKQVLRFFGHLTEGEKLYYSLGFNVTALDRVDKAAGRAYRHWSIYL